MLHDLELTRNAGRVMLVGAGPGPADLMTVRAYRAVQEAQALLYDALVDPEVLTLAPHACLKIETGKRANRPSMKQETINRLMLRLARRGLRVVRLKSGDPSVFGRSGEEAAFLEAHGVPVEVVAGVTAASAAAAQFGFPLTQRGLAQRLVLATARLERGSLVAEGWQAMADPAATVALYMARDSLVAVTDALIKAGRCADTPVIAVENAGRTSARAIKCLLSELALRIERAEYAGPVVVIIGAVAARAWCYDDASLTMTSSLSSMTALASGR
ncbi:MAG: uroporphyrinogen-III C-methyltransferase [Caulobacteraceae bacterium]